jgi:hypothetical protein
MKHWTTKEVSQLGKEIAQLGIGLTCGKHKINPGEELLYEGKRVLALDILLDSFSQAKDIPLTMARRLIEDTLSFAVSQSVPNDHWCQIVLNHGEKWNCSQAWVEKQLKKMVDETSAELKSRKTKEWATFARNEDQAIAFEKLETHYKKIEVKKSKNSTAKNVQQAAFSNSLFGVWR